MAFKCKDGKLLKTGEQAECEKHGYEQPDADFEIDAEII